MNEKQLEIFTTLAQNLNFTKTAEQLFLSQTTVTLQIKNLEEELGVKLFDRTSRNVTLTYAGTVFQKGAVSILSQMKELAMETADAARGYIGQISIGFADDVNATGIAGLVKHFIAEHPEIRLHINGDYPEALWNHVLSDDYDIIFTPSFQRLRDSQLNTVALGRYKSVAAFMKNHRFADMDSVKFEDFEGENYIYISGSQEDLDFSREFVHGARQKGVNIRQYARIDNIDSVFLMLDAGLGITVLPEYFNGRFFGNSEIQVRPIAEDLRPMEFVAAWKPDHRSTAKTRFISFMKEYFKEKIEELN